MVDADVPNYVEYCCDTCGERLCAAPAVIPAGVQTLRCPVCFALHPTLRTLVLRRLADWAGPGSPSDPVVA